MEDGSKTSRTTVRRTVLHAARNSAPSLRVVCTPDRAMLGRELPLDGASYVFGRSSEVTHTIVDERLSRLHLRVEPGVSGYLVEDLESTNGTFLDGRPVKGRFPLQGQVLSAGDTLFVVDRAPDFDHLPSAPDAKGEGVRGIVGRSKATRALRAAVATVAPTDGGVLLLGPTGSGKEVTARAIHEASGRAGPFFPLNCAAIPKDLAEAELFGHERGAFTGADQKRKGAFREASGGTLFLDEVGDLPLELQAKLLRVLEDSMVQPVGTSVPVKVDLRVVAATNVDLERSPRFRRDLLARLCDWVLRIPALAERRADIIPLWEHFLRIEGFSGSDLVNADVYEALLLYDWPMNVRSLRKLARRLVTLVGPDQTIDLSLLPTAIAAPIAARYVSPPTPRTISSTPSATAPIEDSDAEAQSLPAWNAATENDDEGGPSRQELEQALARAKGNVKLAAQMNGWHRTQLYRWLRRRGVDPARFR